MITIIYRLERPCINYFGGRSFNGPDRVNSSIAYVKSILHCGISDIEIIIK